MDIQHFVESLGHLGELGLLGLGLWLFGTLAKALGLPLLVGYIVLGMVFGEQGFIPLVYPSAVTETLADVGVVLLLFFIGLEFSLKRFLEAKTSIVRAGLWDILNFPLGFLVGYALGFGFWQSIFLAGITYISSSGIILRLMSEKDQEALPESERTLGVLVFEDLVMIVYLSALSVFSGGSLLGKAVGIGIFLLFYFGLLRFGRPILERLVERASKEELILGALGGVAMFGALAHVLSFPDAVAAFLLGALIGELSNMHVIEEVLTPWRDVAVGAFFLAFGLQVDPATLIPALQYAIPLVVVTALGKIITGFMAGQRTGLSVRASVGHGLMLIPRGEFSLVIAGMALASPLLGADEKTLLYQTTSAYILILVALGVLISTYHIPLTLWFAQKTPLARLEPDE